MTMRLGNILNWAYIYLCLLTWVADTILGTNLAFLRVEIVVFFMVLFVNSRNEYFRKAFTSGPILIWGIWTLK